MLGRVTGTDVAGLDLAELYGGQRSVRGGTGLGFRLGLIADGARRHASRRSGGAGGGTCVCRQMDLAGLRGRIRDGFGVALLWLVLKELRAGELPQAVSGSGRCGAVRYTDGGAASCAQHADVWRSFFRGAAFAHDQPLPDADEVCCECGEACGPAHGCAVADHETVR